MLPLSFFQKHPQMSTGAHTLHRSPEKTPHINTQKTLSPNYNKTAHIPKNGFPNLFPAILPRTYFLSEDMKDHLNDFYIIPSLRLWFCPWNKWFSKSQAQMRLENAFDKHEDPLNLSIEKLLLVLDMFDLSRRKCAWNLKIGLKHVRKRHFQISRRKCASDN